MNKRLVIEKILAKLVEDMEILHKAARASHAEATHESSKAENKYDTRGLEAAYLAGGQARLAGEMEQTLAQLQALPLADFPAKAPIAVGALVELDTKGERSFFLVGPRGGGVEVELDGCEIMVITPQSPLGQQLMEKKAGDRVKMGQGRQALEYRVCSVV